MNARTRHETGIVNLLKMGDIGLVMKDSLLTPYHNDNSLYLAESADYRWFRMKRRGQHCCIACCVEDFLGPSCVWSHTGALGEHEIGK